MAAALGPSRRTNNRTENEHMTATDRTRWASMMAGLSNDGSSLIFARFLQGVGAAVILPATLSTVNATFQGRERGIAFRVWGRAAHKRYARRVGTQTSRKNGP
jgi:MFS family permease